MSIKLKQYKITLKKFDSNENTVGSDSDNLGLRTKLGGESRLDSK